jgi:hypothetical protein
MHMVIFFFFAWANGINRYEHTTLNIVGSNIGLIVCLSGIGYGAWAIFYGSAIVEHYKWPLASMGVNNCLYGSILYSIVSSIVLPMAKAIYAAFSFCFVTSSAGNAGILSAQIEPQTVQTRLLNILI